MSNQNPIQWFPGHMTKAKRQMEENLKKVDFVIEIRDARIPDSSKNPMLDELIQNKPRLILLSKKDKADSAATKEWIQKLHSQGHQVLALDLIKDSYFKALVQAAQTTCQKIIDKQKRRGIRPRALRAMVCGIPNVGKSTFINTMAKRKAAQTADRPGVTKSLQWIKLGQSLELLDTPGVLWPKFEDPNTGMRLAILGSVRDEVVNMQELAIYACRWLQETKPGLLASLYQIEEQKDPWQTLEKIALKRGYLQKGSIDENRLVRSFIKDIREDKLGPLTWEFPHD
ncbi:MULTISPECIES: ribosome biogenesis GTPase YlqF [Faecalicoccus]|uniref:Ribosome biogenesis GTPase A n=1 Tax=Faecalicoccus pleomorphus TaxID=1323 RepID=A0A3E3E2B6_9FIRM|nr:MULTISPECIES: ribosome biogenesis GTPase YlqF [Faecalicoccus]MBE6119087.1 ribosome biogenesis GTPase YlqF [Erysipelotrichaceae bacterium]MDB7980425.1 ribosome biogenesis GTPase YlqF [Faecalicoccus pleomorphus]MDB7983110.1 ribosome biogenesis GTPase YlqF [Faecalicoccus pleomorphus]MDB7985071.1 ribosome biogenesis GTPase YlqF [Faecalicoccus pleomorphus]MDB7988540.1 ribosome biogenesis GTPase YlqF [Faecalicoccus pleomorphus]